MRRAKANGPIIIEIKLSKNMNQMRLLRVFELKNGPGQSNTIELIMSSVLSFICNHVRLRMCLCMRMCVCMCMCMYVCVHVREMGAKTYRRKLRS